MKVFVMETVVHENQKWNVDYFPAYNIYVCNSEDGCWYTQISGVWYKFGPRIKISLLLSIDIKRILYEVCATFLKNYKQSEKEFSEQTEAIQFKTYSDKNCLFVFKDIENTYLKICNSNIYYRSDVKMWLEFDPNLQWQPVTMVRNAFLEDKYDSAFLRRFSPFFDSWTCKSLLRDGFTCYSGRILHFVRNFRGEWGLTTSVFLNKHLSIEKRNIVELIYFCVTDQLHRSEKRFETLESETNMNISQYVFEFLYDIPLAYDSKQTGLEKTLVRKEVEECVTDSLKTFGTNLPSSKVVSIKPKDFSHSTLEYSTAGIRNSEKLIAESVTSKNMSESTFRSYRDEQQKSIQHKQEDDIFKVDANGSKDLIIHKPLNAQDLQNTSHNDSKMVQHHDCPQLTDQTNCLLNPTLGKLLETLNEITPNKSVEDIVPLEVFEITTDATNIIPKSAFELLNLLLRMDRKKLGMFGICEADESLLQDFFSDLLNMLDLSDFIIEQSYFTHLHSSLSFIKLAAMDDEKLAMLCVASSNQKCQIHDIILEFKAYNEMKRMSSFLHKLVTEYFGPCEIDTSMGAVEFIMSLVLSAFKGCNDCYTKITLGASNLYPLSLVIWEITSSSKNMPNSAFMHFDKINTALRKYNYQKCQHLLNNSNTSELIETMKNSLGDLNELCIIICIKTIQ